MAEMYAPAWPWRHNVQTSRTRSARSARSSAMAWGHEPPAPKDHLPMVACGGDCSGESGDVAAALTEAQMRTTRAPDRVGQVRL